METRVETKRSGGARGNQARRADQRRATGDLGASQDPRASAPDVGLRGRGTRLDTSAERGPPRKQQPSAAAAAAGGRDVTESEGRGGECACVESMRRSSPCLGLRTLGPRRVKDRKAPSAGGMCSPPPTRVPSFPLPTPTQRISRHVTLAVPAVTGVLSPPLPARSLPGGDFRTPGQCDSSCLRWRARFVFLIYFFPPSL